MFENWTFGRKLAGGFGLAGLVLLVISVVAYRTTDTLIRNEEMVAHTYEVRAGLANLLSELEGAETGQRGYLIIGDESYLEPYRSALPEINTTMGTLRRLTTNDPNQQKRLAALQPLIDSKLAGLATRIDVRRTQGFEAAAALLVKMQGQEIMNRIRTIIDEADQQETDLLTERNKLAQASAAMAMKITLWGGIFGVLAVGIIGWFITSSLIRQIGAAVEQVQSSSAELQSVANQQATGSREQSSAMNEIATTMSELLATSRQIAESAQQVAQIADQTAASARLGNGTVGTTQESIMGIRRQVDQIVGHMLELGKKSQEIGSVLDIVSELAEQTNILAINATIEAVGAGDAGKRFAVVADEIRKLADRVGGSTKEIRTLIDDVQSAVNTTVMATETGSKAVDAGSQQFSDVAVAFKQIGTMVTTSMEAAREIELSTKQQTTAVEQVNVAISNVAQASRENEISSGQTLLTASQLASLSQELLRVIRPLTSA